MSSTPAEPPAHVLDPARDLVLARRIPAPPSALWRAWTEPALLTRWFTPAPWSTAEATIELYPGGAFTVVLRAPDGALHPSEGCILAVVPDRRLVWTVALAPGFRPAARAHPVPDFTAIIDLEPDGDGTRYTATVLHRDPAGARRHAALGFADGWGAALDQLAQLVTAP